MRSVSGRKLYSVRFSSWAVWESCMLVWALPLSSLMSSLSALSLWAWGSLSLSSESALKAAYTLSWVCWSGASLMTGTDRSCCGNYSLRRRSSECSCRSVRRCSRAELESWDWCCPSYYRRTCVKMAPLSWWVHITVGSWRMTCRLGGSKCRRWRCHWRWTGWGTFQAFE